jgi:hypothetical protein
MLMNMMNTPNGWDFQQQGDDDEDAVAPGTAADSPWPDPWTGSHNIEYWVWSEGRLVPATRSQRAAIQEMERTRAARRRLAVWHRDQHAVGPSARGVRRIAGAWLALWREVRRVAIGARPANAATDTDVSSAPATHTPEAQETEARETHLQDME